MSVSLNCVENPCDGTVKWFNDSKGFGFLSVSGVDEDVFVHYTDVTGKGHITLKPGQPVQCKVKRGARGLQAVEVSSSVDLEIAS